MSVTNRSETSLRSNHRRVRLEAPSPVRRTSTGDQRVYSVFFRLRQQLPDTRPARVLGQLDIDSALAVGDDWYRAVVCL